MNGNFYRKIYITQAFFFYSELFYVLIIISQKGNCIMEKSTYKVYICTSERFSQMTIERAITKYLEKDNVEIKIYSQSDLIQKKTNTVDQVRQQIVKYLFQTIKNEKTFVFLESNRLDFKNDYKGEKNEYGEVANLYNQLKNKGELQNGQRILLFDAQEWYQNPYSLQEQGWRQFNQVFCNYWYSAKGTDSYSRSSNYFALNKNNIQAFLSFNIDRINMNPRAIFVMTNSDHERTAIKANRQRIKKVIQFNKPPNEQQNLPSTTQPIIMSAEKISIFQANIIRGYIEKGLKDPNTIAFIRDDVVYYDETKDFSGNRSFVSVYREDFHNTWKQFFSQIDYNWLLNQGLQGNSMGFLHRKLGRKIAAKFETQEDVINNLRYFTQFNAGTLTRVLQRRYIASYVEKALFQKGQ